MTLYISDELQLPDTVVTESLAILAKRGTGKSNAGVVIAEEITDIGHQWVSIDPKGDWWGIRSNADGTGPGLQVPIFGGSHGDVPLEATGGAVMARLIVEQGLSCLLDVSEFSKGDQIRFVTDFCEQLFRSVKADPRPLMLILEEAEEFLPQRVDARSARMVGICSKISKQGRQIGLGVLLITQRSASLNKDALSQIDTLILFRTTSPHDRKAVVAWADHQGEAGEIAESLSSLEPGESWVISPGYLGSVQRIRWRRRRTFDSGATPSTAGARRPVPDLGSIDLEAIAELLADTIERAAADDPKVLRRRIAELEADLAAALAATPDPVEVRIEVPVLDPELAQHLRDLGHRHDQLATELSAAAAAVTIAARAAGAPPAPPGPPPAAPRGTTSEQNRTRRGTTVERSATPPPRVAADRADVSLSKAERAVLTVLAQHPAGRTRVQLALLSGYSVKSSSLSNALGSLRGHGLVSKGPEPITATPAGLAALGDIEPLPQGPDLLAHWMSRLTKAEREILTALIDAYPDELTKEQLAEQTPSKYSPTSSSMSNALGKLRSLELVDGWRAADDLMDSIA